MTANVVHPAELERILQARVQAAHERRARAHRPGSRAARPFRRGSLALVAGAMLALSAAAAWASHGSPYIDITADDSTVTHNSAIFTQGGVGAGTGNFDPFLTLSPGGSTDTEQGYNICSEPVFGYPTADCPDAQFDELEGGDRTHELLASSIPTIDVGGTLYREFFLDSNDSGADPWMAITIIKLFTDDQPDLTDYVPGTETFGNDTGTAATVIWDMDDTGDSTILMNTQGLESGSGVSDMSVLVPASLFPADCDYGSLECDTYVYFYTVAGDPDLEVGGIHEGKDWNTTAGFEEWSIELLPVVNVAKTVDISFDRTYPWDVEKTADVETIDLFAGDTAEIDWTVTVSAGDPVDSDALISGAIEIQNPTGTGFAIEDAIEAEVISVEDVLTLGGVDHDATVVCPEDPPFTLDAGDTVTCTYSYAPGPDDLEDGENVATVTLGIYVTDKGQTTLVDTAEYSDTQDVLFANADVTEIDNCITVTDDNATPADDTDDLDLGEVCIDDLDVNGEYEFPPFTTDVGPFDVAECDSVTITNTAYTVTNDTETEDDASDSVDVNCYELTVAKTVEESLTRTWAWDLEKEADVSTIELFAGDSATIEWSVTLVSEGSSDDEWHVEGVITVSNPAPIVAEDVVVSDVISGFAGTITIDCGDGTATTDVPAAAGGVAGTATCDYEADLPNGTARTNTATATLFGIDYDSDAEDVDFTGATVTDVDDCITVTDDNATPGDATDDVTFSPDPVCLDDLDANGEYEFDPFSTDVGPFTVENCTSLEITNTADSLTADDAVTDSADATVDVNCYELSVTKDATTSYSRDYDWLIEKTRFFADGEVDGDGLLGTLTLSEGQSFDVSYEITVTMTGFADDDHAVDGTITIYNPAPMDAEGVVVSDLVSPDIAATVDCDNGTPGLTDTVDVPAAVLGVPGEAECTYSTDLPDATSRTNTATATLFGIDYDSAAVDVTFDLENPTVEIDECIDITDDAGTPLDTTDDIDLGTVCIGDLDENDQWTDTYVITVGPFEVCGEYTLINTVSWVTTDDANDTDESGSDSFTIVIDVPCPEGCTLTQGYWKTHNDTFWGGAPSDDTWYLLGDVDGDGASEGELETFFLSGGTYFDAMWTAPQGNAYYQLSRQYIAAILNQLDGAFVPGNVQDAIDAAEHLFETYTPAQVAAAKGKGGKELRSQFTTLAGLLASYNEGLIGPGHCDEDPNSDSGSTGSSTLLADRRTSFSMS